ncbi:MAG: recombinase [Firmicutes bacterium]|nr:recombinase [Bacillota bacterium]
MNSVLKKLFEIQQELKVPKNQRNNFGNYNFRNCEDIMEASKPVCKKHNCLLTCSDEVIYVGDRYYIRATATLYDLDSNESISTTAEAREEETKKGMDASQITGASSSYARKYALNGLLQLDDNKDADTTEYQKQNNVTKKTTNQEMITEEQIKLIHVLFGKIEKSENQIFKNFENMVAKQNVYKKFKVRTSKELTKEKAKELIELLKSKLGE